eukprot:Platyproteum_vivax@DN8904_c0_g1_i1.p1
MGMIYVHVEHPTVEERMCLVFEHSQRTNARIGQLKNMVIQEINLKGTDIKYDDCSMWNTNNCPIADACLVETQLIEDEFVFGAKAPSKTAMESNLQKKKELSYYYAHNTNYVPAPTPPSVNAVLKPKNTEESSRPYPLSSYKTLSAYSWEDKSKSVRVRFPTDKLGGSVDPSNVTSTFGEKKL